MICIEINHTGARNPWWVDSPPPRLLDRQNIPALLGLSEKKMFVTPDGNRTEGHTDVIVEIVM